MPLVDPLPALVSRQPRHALSQHTVLPSRFQRGQGRPAVCLLCPRQARAGLSSSCSPERWGGQRVRLARSALCPPRTHPSRPWPPGSAASLLGGVLKRGSSGRIPVGLDRSLRDCSEGPAETRSDARRSTRHHECPSGISDVRAELVMGGRQLQTPQHFRASLQENGGIGLARTRGTPSEDLLSLLSSHDPSRRPYLIQCAQSALLKAQAGSFGSSTGVRGTISHYATGAAAMSSCTLHLGRGTRAVGRAVSCQQGLRGEYAGRACGRLPRV